MDALKQVVQNGMHSVGLHLSRYPLKSEFENDLQELLSRLGIDCVLDVGAHHGNYGALLRSLGYEGAIESFEPVSETFQVLSRRAAGDPRWTCHRFGLGSDDETLSINIMARSTFNSLLQPSEYGVQHFTTSLASEATERVEIRRLDTVLGERVADASRRRMLLKIDTQGYDLAVLQGAGEWIHRFCALQLEVAVHPIYEGVKNLPEMLAYLGDLGFEIVSLAPVSRTRSGAIVEYDCLLQRAA